MPWQDEYRACRICGESVSPELHERACRRYEKPVCGAECIRAEILRRFACCPKATPTPCVCAYSFECPEHGQRHVGGHD